MLTITTSVKQHQAARALIIPLSVSYKESSLFKDLCHEHSIDFSLLLEDAKFSSKNGAFFSYTSLTNDAIKTFIFVGYSLEKDLTTASLENYRRAVGAAIKYIQRSKITSASLVLPDHTIFNCSVEYLVEQTILIAAMAQYHFDEFITNPERKTLQDLQLELITSIAGDFSKAIAQGQALGKAVNQARHWVDLPAGSLNPSDIVAKVKTIAQEQQLTCTIFDQQQILAMGMGGLAGVSQGSDQPCALAILEYKTSVPHAPTLALVGKGVTFDSGGLSLKPAESMESMKDDMAGAAAVMSAMEILAQLKPAINIVALAPLTENLPSGKALKPGDIITFYNGKTAEVRNTDAEGRLILADALSYAVKHYKPDAIIDLATLTGACAYALGPFFAGMMSQHNELAQQLKRAGDRTGDRVWALPFTDDYKPAVRSQVADICNIGSRKYRAGAVTAGFFLQEFVGDTPWVHLDIAGVAFEVPDISYYSHGATGFGVRLLIDFAMHWHNK